MWVIRENGTAINLSKCYSIYFNKYSNLVVANYEDEQEFRIKKVDNENDAKKFIADLVEKLNAEKNIVTFGDILTRSENQSENAAVLSAPVVVALHSTSTAEGHC